MGHSVRANVTSRLARRAASVAACLVLVSMSVNAPVAEAAPASEPQIGAVGPSAALPKRAAATEIPSLRTVTEDVPLVVEFGLVRASSGC
jgi:hypothetical protein